MMQTGCHCINFVLAVQLLFTKLETADFLPFLATVIFIGNYTSRELVVQFVADKKWDQ